MVRFWKTIVTGVALAMAVMPQMTQAQIERQSSSPRRP